MWRAKDVEWMEREQDGEGEVGRLQTLLGEGVEVEGSGKMIGGRENEYRRGGK